LGGRAAFSIDRRALPASRTDGEAMSSDESPSANPLAILDQERKRQQEVLAERRRVEELEAAAKKDQQALLQITPEILPLDDSQGLTWDEMFGFSSDPPWAAADHPGWDEWANAYFRVIEVVRRRGYEGRLDAPLRSYPAWDFPLSLLRLAQKGEAVRGELAQVIRTACEDSIVGWKRLLHWMCGLVTELFPEIVGACLGRVCPRCQLFRRPDEFPRGAFDDPGRIPAPCNHCSGLSPATPGTKPRPDTPASIRRACVEYRDEIHRRTPRDRVRLPESEDTSPWLAESPNKVSALWQAMRDYRDTHSGVFVPEPPGWLGADPSEVLLADLRDQPLPAGITLAEVEKALDEVMLWCDSQRPIRLFRAIEQWRQAGSIDDYGERKYAKVQAMLAIREAVGELPGVMERLLTATDDAPGRASALAFLFRVDSENILQQLPLPQRRSDTHSIYTPMDVWISSGLWNEVMGIVSPADLDNRTGDVKAADDKEDRKLPDALLPILLPASALARHLKLETNPVDVELRRYREKFPDCAVDTAAADSGSRRRNEPRWLYRTADVLPRLRAHFALTDH
jgi:hypothetical protein